MRWGSKSCMLHSWAVAHNSFSRMLCSASSGSPSLLLQNRAAQVVSRGDLLTWGHNPGATAVLPMSTCYQVQSLRICPSFGSDTFHTVSARGPSPIGIAQFAKSMGRRKAAVSDGPLSSGGRRRVHVAASDVGAASGEQLLHASPRSLTHRRSGASSVGMEPNTPVALNSTITKVESLGVSVKGKRSKTVAQSATSAVVTTHTGHVASTGRKGRSLHSAGVRELLPAEEGLDENYGLTQDEADYLRLQIEKTVGVKGSEQGGAHEFGAQNDAEEKVTQKKSVRRGAVKKQAQAVEASLPPLATAEEGEVVGPKGGRKKAGRRAVKGAEGAVSDSGETLEAGGPKRARKDAPNRVWKNGNILSPWRSLPAAADIIGDSSGALTIKTEVVEDVVVTPKPRKGRNGKKASTVVVEEIAEEGEDIPIAELADTVAIKKVKRSRRAAKVETTEGGENEGEAAAEEIPKPVKRSRKAAKVITEGGGELETEADTVVKRKRKRKEVKAEGQEEEGEDAVDEDGEEKENSWQIKAKARAAAKVEVWLEEDRKAEEERQQWLKTLPHVPLADSLKTRLGYACICTELRMLKPASRSVFCSRHLTLKTLAEKGSEEAKLRALQNLADLKTIIEWNERHGIRFFRLSSQIFPHLENPLVAEKDRYNLDFARDVLKEVGELARKYSHRLTFHPSHFNQLGSAEGKVLDGTFADLRMHADVLDAMGCNQDSVLIVHGGGAYGDKDAALERVRQNVRKLPNRIRQRLVFENDEKVYHTNLLLPLSEELQVPICVDYFHHQCYGEEEFDIYDPELTARIMKVWQNRGMKPKCHISEQAPDAPVGAHSDAIDVLPEKLLAIARKYNMDIMLESKDKEQSLGKLLERYFARGVDDGRLTYALKADTA